MENRYIFITLRINCFTNWENVLNIWAGTISEGKKFDRYTPPRERTARDWSEKANRSLQILKQVEFSSLDNTNCHDLDGRFRFQIHGEFKGNVDFVCSFEDAMLSIWISIDKGVKFSLALKRIADDMHLVGWCRIRNKGGEGVVRIL